MKAYKIIAYIIAQLIRCGHGNGNNQDVLPLSALVRRGGYLRREIYRCNSRCCGLVRAWMAVRRVVQGHLAMLRLRKSTTMADKLIACTCGGKGVTVDAEPPKEEGKLGKARFNAPRHCGTL
ncbi:MAG: hypothetical protein ACLS48_10035 [[Eubacterium] siraeum]